MRSTCLVFSILASSAVSSLVTGPVALAADAPTVSLEATFKSWHDNGMGNTLAVKAKGKKVLFFLPPDGSGSGLEKLKAGDALTVVYRDAIEERVFRAKRGGCPKRNPKRVFCVAGTLEKTTQGDMGLYFSLDRDGKKEEWLSDFEPKGNAKLPRDAGKKVALSYRRKPKKEFVSFKAAGDAAAAGSAAGAVGSAAGSAAGSSSGS